MQLPAITMEGRYKVMDPLAQKLDITKTQMRKLGFKYDNELDDYIYKFVVYRYDNIPLLCCKLGIDEETKRVWYDIYNMNNTLYAPYYNRRYGHNLIIQDIEKAVSDEWGKLGIPASFPTKNFMKKVCG